MPSRDPAVRRATNVRFYERNRAAEIERVRLRKITCRAWLNEQKQKPCADCGGVFPPVVMDFDHLGDDKTSTLSRMAHRGTSRQRMLEEIGKCDLVCANCHRVRTYLRWLATLESNQQPLG